MMVTKQSLLELVGIPSSFYTCFLQELLYHEFCLGKRPFSKWYTVLDFFKLPIYFGSDLIWKWPLFPHEMFIYLLNCDYASVDVGA